MWIQAYSIAILEKHQNYDTNCKMLNFTYRILQNPQNENLEILYVKRHVMAEPCIFPKQSASFLRICEIVNFTYRILQNPQSGNLQIL